ncbi:MAG: Gx transporter family protein [Eubacterium sp.]|nr:Gx transporter family protein [Eubacterium sp.]
MKASSSSIHRLTRLAIYIAAAFLISYIESLVPLPLPFPGMKLGLANLVMLIVLYQNGLADALIVSVLRSILNSLTFGNLFSLFYGLAGGIFSLLVMALLHRIKKTERDDALSVISISCIGGVCHNAGQFVVAWTLVGFSALVHYAPFLYFSGMIAGILVGIFAKLCLQRLPH